MYSTQKQHASPTRQCLSSQIWGRAGLALEKFGASNLVRWQGCADYSRIIGASLSESHTCQMASPAIFIYIYIYVYIFICMSRTSFRKCPRILIHWTALILQCVIMQFRKCHHVQIIETASILHLQWAYSTTMSVCRRLLTFTKQLSLDCTVVSPLNRSTTATMS